MEAGPGNEEGCTGAKEKAAVLTLQKESMVAEAPAF